MGQGTTVFLLGILAFQQLRFLPSPGWAGTLPIVVALAWRYRWLRLPAWFAGGFLWTLLHAGSILDAGLAAALEGKDVVVEGVIASIPQQMPGLTRFELDVERIGFHGLDWPSPGRVRLGWYERVPDLATGDRWRLVVRLKRPHGLANPGGFDLEASLFRKRIRATGYVRESPANVRLASAVAYPLQRLRQSLGLRIAQAIPDAELGGVITALAIGDQQRIRPAQWEVFRRTGTTHLVAVSGLHIALVAGLFFFAVRFAWSRVPVLALACPAPCAGAVAALAAAIGYAGLAGFSVPTQRAVIMVAAALVTLLLRRTRSLRHTLTVTLLAVLLYDPLAVMDVGAWLSFGAVAVILFSMHGPVDATGWWWRWGRLHVAIFIGLVPLMLLLFQQLPMLSPLANFIAVPYMDILMVPLVLSGCVLLVTVPALGEYVLRLADWLLSMLWSVLVWLAKPEALQWSQHMPAMWTIPLAAIGVGLMLAPRGFPGRWLGVLWLMPALMVVPRPPAEGQFRLTLIDVGQGLAAVVRTLDHALVFDTGPRFAPDFDAGGVVLVPYLRHEGIRAIDMLVLSHGDSDHVGGAETLAGAFPIGRVSTSVPEKVSWQAAERCAAGTAWMWDGVHFEWLHPEGGEFSGNDASCVLSIGNAAGRVLLTGDIQARAELALVNRQGDRLSADILVAPHHGSKSSSTAAFVAAVHPRYVLFAVGYRNRWGFPNREVAARYEAIDARAFDSANHGAIAFDVPANGPLPAPKTYRQERMRYWHAR